MTALSSGSSTLRSAGRVAIAFPTAGCLLSALIVAMHVANSDVPFRGEYTHYAYNVAIETLLLVGLGGLILRGHPRHPVGMLLVGIGLLAGCSAVGLEYALLGADDGSLLPGASWGWWLGAWAWHPGYIVPAILLPILVPTGRPPSRWWWPVVLAAVALISMDTAWFAFMPFDQALPPVLATLAHPLGRQGTPKGFGEIVPGLQMIYLAFVVAALAALGARWRRSQGPERLQIRWFALGIMLWAVAVAVDTAFRYSERWVWAELIPLTLPVLGAAISIAFYDLLDLQRVIHRGGALAFFAASAGVLYVSMVFLGEHVLSRRGNQVWSAVVVALIAAAALPVLRWLDDATHRLVYGQRARPLSVLAAVSSELESLDDPAAALHRAADAILSSLRLPYVQIAADGIEPVTAGSATTGLERWPLTDAGLQIGELAVGQRSVGERLTDDDRWLLDQVADRLGASVRVAGLTTRLRSSREELVLAREEERRRIRHDLHDGLGPRLAGIGLQLDLGQEFFNSDPSRALAMFSRAKAEVDAALIGIRDLVEGMRPVALDELGLLGAIRQQVHSLDATAAGGLSFTVGSDWDLVGLSAAVEVAAYRIAVEAATNAARHSGGQRCVIQVVRASDLTVAVTDDGNGIPATADPGVGLTSMRNRAEELGGRLEIGAAPSGGTRITARIPLR